MGARNGFGDRVVVGGLGLVMLAGGAVAAVPTFVEESLGELFSFIRDIDIVDLDGDGDNDLLVSDLFLGSQVWLENDGATPPAFTRRTYATTGGQYLVATGDVNGDGFLDILSASPNGGDRIYWHESDGGSPPVFTAHEIAQGAANSDPYCVALGDLDGDGDLDAVGHFNEPQLLEWYENSGGLSPTWTTRTLDADSGNLRSLQVVDIDGDGDRDIMFSGWNALGPAPSDEDGIGWMENVGGTPPAFVKREIGIAPQFQSTYFDTEMVDVDGDGDLDAFTALYSPGLVGFFANSGGPNPTWTLESIGDAGAQSFDVAAADFDLDGDLDAASIARDLDTITWFENTTASRSLTWETRDIPATLDRPEVAAAGDVTNDGVPDIVVGWVNAPRTISVYENQFVPTPSCSGDIDGDGDTDVFDFADLAENFGAGPGATREQGDLTGDGFVDVFDFGELAEDFGCQ